jgi:uncharacterized protein (TIGR01777 family)
MKIAISGSAGFIGSALWQALEGQGHHVVPMIRPSSKGANRTSTGETIAYDPTAGTIDTEALSRVDAVIHLAGESIAGYWTAAKRRRLVQSRVDSTRLIAQTLAAAQPKPSVLITASAIGYYGSRDRPVTEQNPAGDSFLARLCVDWEAAVRPVTDAGIRTVQIRLGMVLSPAGGSLKAMLPAFRMGLGAVLGDGRQVWSWITLEDAVRAIQWILDKPELSGPVNLASPNPVSNAEFTRTLALACRRKVRLRIAAWILKAGLDGFAAETLLASTIVIPDKLIKSGFIFLDPALPEALFRNLV